MISCKNLVRCYTLGSTPVYALDHLNLEIENGEFVAIMGPSGSGKSTLMNVLGLLDVPDSGSYALNGKPTENLSEEALSKLRSQSIGFIFQQFNLLKRTTALENVSLPLLYSDLAADGLPEELLRKVGLGERMDHKPNELSGGQQQRVAIARALVNRPRIILADEPTGNLDSKSQSEIMDLLSQLHAEGITVILVTHEEAIAQYANRIIRMRDGKIISDISQNEHKKHASSPQRLSPSLHERHSFSALKIYFNQAWLSLINNKLRSFLSVLGIFIGVAAVIAMLALGKGAQTAIEDRLASLGSNLLTLRMGSAQSMGVNLGAGATAKLTLPDNQSIQGLLNVKRTSPSVSGRVQVEAGNQNYSTQLIGTLPTYAEMRAAKPTLGRFFTSEEIDSRAKVVVIGVSVLKKLYGENSDNTYKNPVGDYIKLNRIRFQIIGVLPEKGATSFRDEDDVVMIPISTAMKRVLGKEFINSIDIEVSDPTAIDSVQSTVINLMMQRHRVDPKKNGTFEIRNLAEIQETLSATSKTMSLLLAIIASISLLVGGIGIMNIMLVSVTERTREIGLRKAIGATPKDILAQFLIESVVISSMGGVLGILLGCGITLLLGQIAGWAVAISPMALMLSFFFSASIGIGFGLWPARKAAQLNPIDALRYE